MNNDLISREALKKVLTSETRDNFQFVCLSRVLEKIDNAPTVEPTFGMFREMLCSECEKNCTECKEKRPQGEYVDISKLRRMTVEECAGHTIDYAMGWKACIEWIRKGGAE